MAKTSIRQKTLSRVMSLLDRYCFDPALCLRLTLTNTNIMRIALSLIVVLLGANLMIDILDSNMMDIIEDRQNTIEKLIEES